MQRTKVLPPGCGRYLWLDGEIREHGDIGLSVLTHGLNYGTTVFEGIRAYDFEPFRLTDHSVRLQRSAEAIGFALPFDTETLDAATRQVLLANGEPNAYVRPLAWRGSGDMGVAGPKSGVHVAIATCSWPAVFANGSNGIRVTCARWRRPRPDQAPIQAKASSNYLIGAMARTEAAQFGFDDALLLDPNGNVAEVTGANLFMVNEHGRFQTPPAEFCLNGLTRQTVINLAQATLDMAVEERHFGLDALNRAREVFVVGTAYEVQPIREVDQTRFEIGPVTRQLRESYYQLTRRTSTRVMAFSLAGLTQEINS